MNQKVSEMQPLRDVGPDPSDSGTIGMMMVPATAGRAEGALPAPAGARMAKAAMTD